MDHQVEKVRDLLKAEDGVQGTVVGKQVYDPYLFSPGFAKFTATNYLFLRAYRLGVPIEDACAKAGISIEQAERFLDKPATKAWLEDRAIKDYIKNEWQEPGKWYKEGDDCFEGKRSWTKAQLEIWKAFGERVAPVKRSSEANSAPKIEINIDPTAVQEAFRRQNAIEAELLEDRKEA